jgi:phosphatidylserine/phosphatidylglycerophosphate/cardiolipin synthase-like enzyme
LNERVVHTLPYTAAMRTAARIPVVVLGLFFAACGGVDLVEDGEDDVFLDGKSDGNGVREGSPGALAALALCNDPAVDGARLSSGARISRRVADGIVAARPFATLAQLDRVKYVGPATLARLVDHALAEGYPKAGGTSDVIFSPQPYEDSHNVRVAGLIQRAARSLDIAMYSYSDTRIAAALEDAVRRGVKVRFLFDTAAEDRKLSGPALLASKSGRLEAMGIEVRWVNKVMHHKFVLIDGPRDDAAHARGATLVTGSGNWSNGAATRYDENTLFLANVPELALRFQREFDLLWNHSRPVDANPALAWERSGRSVTDADLAAADDAGLHALFTSANFSVSGDTFRIDGRDEISTALVAAIKGARRSIHVASGHLRSRPVAEALMARAEDGLDLRVYLDGQEYISESTHRQQERELAACIAGAGSSASKLRDCYDRGFLFGYAVGRGAIQVRYKYYAYRWDASYAEQMHHKYLIVDGETLYTGSYNLSDNAEHNTFENLLVFSGAAYAGLVARYEDNFERIWDTGRVEGRLAALRAQLAGTGPVPLVFAPMALTWDEVGALKRDLLLACPAANSEPYRTEPTTHRTCPR